MAAFWRVVNPYCFLAILQSMQYSVACVSNYIKISRICQFISLINLCILLLLLNCFDNLTHFIKYLTIL